MTDEYQLPEQDDVLLAECRVDTFRSGGKGGQHQNKTESGVRLTHGPTGIVVRSRRHRSQHQNRSAALARLRLRIAERLAPRAERHKTRIPRREKERRREEKRRRARIKRDRRRPESDD